MNHDNTTNTFDLTSKFTVKSNVTFVEDLTKEQIAQDVKTCMNTYCMTNCAAR